MNTPVDPEKFLQTFAQQFEEKSRKSISLRTPFKQIEGWSSLQALIVTIAIHEEWGVSFSDEDFRNSQTVNDLFNITQSKVEQ